MEHWKRIVATAITVAAIATVAWLSRSSTPVRSRDDVTGTAPLDRCVAMMVAAAQEGDVAAYVDCFTGALKDTLQTRLAKLADDQAAAELKGGEAELKSYVTTDWKFVDTDEATLRLERVYGRFNKCHTVHLRKIGRSWKIAELIPLQTFAPEIPYGTPVFEPPSGGSTTTSPNASPARE